MQWKYRIFYILTLLLNILFWYYTMAFCAVYVKTSLGWVYSSIITLLLSWFILELIEPVSGAIIRSIVSRWQSMRYKFFYIDAYCISKFIFVVLLGLYLDRFNSSYSIFIYFYIFGILCRIINIK